MTFLGYEYLEVVDGKVEMDAQSSLGVLRSRNTSGERDLAADIGQQSAEELLRRQLSFSKSLKRARVHRQAYPDYVEIKVFDDRGGLVGQHRLLGLYQGPGTQFPAPR